MDLIGWYMATMHVTVGHDTAARVFGVTAGDKNCCLLCRYESTGSSEDRQAAIDAIGKRR